MHLKEYRLTIFVLILATAIMSFGSCAGKEAPAKKAVADYLKPFGVQDLEVDMFHTNPNFTAAAYVSVTATYNYASADGKPQKEYLGFILKKDGEAWKIDHGSPYTKEPTRADDYLAGRK
jgi:hypothetical protein